MKKNVLLVILLLGLIAPASNKLEAMKSKKQKTKSTKLPFLDLPVDCSSHVLSFLDSETLHNLEMVNTDVQERVRHYFLYTDDSPRYQKILFRAFGFTRDVEEASLKNRVKSFFERITFRKKSGDFVGVPDFIKEVGITLDDLSHLFKAFRCITKETKAKTLLGETIQHFEKEIKAAFDDEKAFAEMLRPTPKRDLRWLCYVTFICIKEKVFSTEKERLRGIILDEWTTRTKGKTFEFLDGHPSYTLPTLQEDCVPRSLLEASKYGCPELVEYLLNHRPHFSSDVIFTAYCVSFGRYPKIAEKLLVKVREDRGVFNGILDDRDLFFFTKAIKNYRIDLIREFLLLFEVIRQSVDILKVAIKANSIESVLLFLYNDKFMSRLSTSSFQYDEILETALETNNIEMAQLFLYHYSFMNEISSYQLKNLFKAALETNNIEMAQLFLHSDTILKSISWWEKGLFFKVAIDHAIEIENLWPIQKDGQIHGHRIGKLYARKAAILFTGQNRK